MTTNPYEAPSDEPQGPDGGRGRASLWVLLGKGLVLGVTTGATYAVVGAALVSLLWFVTWFATQLAGTLQFGLLMAAQWLTIGTVAGVIGSIGGLLLGPLVGFIAFIRDGRAVETPAAMIGAMLSATVAAALASGVLYGRLEFPASPWVLVFWVAGVAAWGLVTGRSIARRL